MSVSELAERNEKINISKILKLMSTLVFLINITASAQIQDEAIVIEDNLFLYSEPNKDAEIIYSIERNEVFLLVETWDSGSEWVGRSSICNSRR